MSAPRYEHDAFEAVANGVRLRGRTILSEDRTIQALPTEDGRAVRLEGGFVSMPPEAARALAASLLAAADTVEAARSVSRMEA